MTPISTLSPATRTVLVVLAIVLLASAVRNIKEEGDFRGYLEVGELVLRGGDIYAEARPDVNTWPPLFAVLCVPFALLARVSVYLARAVWLGINVACVIAMLRLAVTLVHHRPLVLTPTAERAGVALASFAVLGPLMLSARFLLGNLDRLQINMLILTACLLGCVWLTRGRAVAGGAIIGVAAAVKVLPIFFLPYFAWKRWWTALAAALVAGGLASLAPIVVFGPARFLAYVRYWLALSAGSWPVRKGNQSVYAMVDRLYTHDAVVWSPAHKRLTASNDPAVALLVYGLLAGDRPRVRVGDAARRLPSRSSGDDDRAGDRVVPGGVVLAAGVEALFRVSAARAVRAVARRLRARPGSPRPMRRRLGVDARPLLRADDTDGARCRRQAPGANAGNALRRHPRRARRPRGAALLAQRPRRARGGAVGVRGAGKVTCGFPPSAC